MLLMVVERFKPGAIPAIHQRYDARGRILPPGVTYVSSWIDAATERCFQLMEAADTNSLQPWIDSWSDLIEFEIAPVVPSATFWETMQLRHAYEIEIASPPAAVWKALTNGDLTERYWFNSRIESPWTLGGAVRILREGVVGIEGVVTEVQEPRVLGYTWAHSKNETDAELANDPPSHVRWTIEPSDAGCRVTLVHDGFTVATKTYKVVRRGWNFILAGLQTLLETGSTLTANWGADTDDIRTELVTELQRGLVYETYIAASADRISDALGSADITRRWEPMRVSWQVTPMGASCRVVFVHDDIATDDEVRKRWAGIVCGVKRLIERDASFDTPLRGGSGEQ